MKSPARLGERAPSTSTPSTGVETRAAGEGGCSCASASLVLMRFTLGEATDTPTVPAPWVG